MIQPVILAGGSGSRLWPLSRKLNPKQFLDLVEKDRSMLQATLGRLEGLEVSGPTIICNEDHRFLAAEQMRQANFADARIILEPVGRNTAPAIALASLEAVEGGEDPVLLVLAADHLISDVGAFQEQLAVATPLAEQGKLITFGIVPTCPETGYGYIHRGSDVVGGGYTVSRFVEKPDLMMAEQYVASCEYLWNSGMFMFRASRYLEELGQFRPDILKACRSAVQGKVNDMDFVRVDPAAFEACPEDSVDYAVMERTKDAVVVSLDAGWSDIGSWSSLWSVSDRNAEGNVLSGDVIAVETEDTLVRADHRLVATLGVKDLVVVETKDAVLVAHKDQVQGVKKVVEQLEKDARNEHINHREVYRPWGVYDSVDNGHRYQVKRITVKPGQKLSLQMHHHRAEHWIVVSGTAKVTNGENSYLVSENQSTYIPIGQVHTLENPGVINLELIEVQSGSYLGEDDIVRFEDRYGRR
ncbi:mannose-1-phosphate guanylyltransferase/mannose-6-phosphate isomerase [Marinobacter sp. M1N3S26]|uniref:mannose-1-phosphate guanylyltransferase/mannose-6-phosphate isomerase n=1 Tax=Marinobacter sp. M1N3S26 TaxID=3382299 RepID=UPI00387AFC83